MKEADYGDPFAPDLHSTKQVRCIHCNELYLENEVKWDKDKELWVCKFWPECDGAGVGFDIFHEVA